MSETEKTPAKPKTTPTKTAQEDLKIGWAIAYASGSDVPVDALDSDVAKANDWAAKVK